MIEKLLDGISKSVITIRALCFVLWSVFVILICYSHAEYINYKITGYNTANFFETQSLIYSILKVLTSIQPQWIILSFLVVMLLQFIIYKLLSLISNKHAGLLEFILFSIGIYILFQVNSFFAFLLLAIYILLTFSDLVLTDIKWLVREENRSVKINLSIGVFAYALLFIGFVLFFLWQAAEDYEQTNRDFTRNICTNLKVVVVLDKSNMKHVGWHLNSNENFLTIKEKIKDNFYELVSINKAEIVLVQSFSLDFSAEKERTFLECREI